MCLEAPADSAAALLVGAIGKIKMNESSGWGKINISKFPKELSCYGGALSRDTVDYPELVKPMQERTGCLMYATTSTRPDIAYVVGQLCKCMHKPTPELIAETDHLLSYLARTADLGLTYSPEQARLSGFADASSGRSSTPPLGGS